MDASHQGSRSVRTSVPLVLCCTLVHALPLICSSALVTFWMYLRPKIACPFCAGRLLPPPMPCPAQVQVLQYGLDVPWEAWVPGSPVPCRVGGMPLPCWVSFLLLQNTKQQSPGLPGEVH
ncbi:hypothetical protein B0T24DRAFT_393849 [Lasiosphaeria ovina]|uniref:Uncharacterized protein n=1 Tax=Lasiosphaeria ovina TaxID=92902 RepID=A0AAE0JWB6_9PEZI|nr:hypothetical protein B0T24DRAFT_393849 [Lasiosphaeria ovina]